MMSDKAATTGRELPLERERIYELVRTDIISCTLMPGRELREAALAGHYGVSKSPVRDAMQKLEAEGLIEVEPRRGYRIAQVRVDDAEHVLDLREILESAVVRRVARNASNADLAALDRFREPDTSTIEAFAAENEAFHRGLSDLSGNPRLGKEVRRIMEYYRRLVILSLTMLTEEPGGSFEKPVADHIKIIDALQARQGGAAAQHVARHINRSRKQIMRGLSARAVVG